MSPPIQPDGFFLIKNLMPCVRNHWDIIPHLHQTQFAKLQQLIWVNRK